MGAHRRGGRGRVRPLVLLLLGALGVAAAAAVLLPRAGVRADFTASTSATGSVATADLSQYVPATVGASRLDASTCRVTWTASATANPPSGLTYDVGDGTSTLASGVAGLTVDLSTAAGITPQVRARVGTWTSATVTVSSGPCGTAPGAPTGVTVTPGSTQLAVSWTAPASTGGSPITQYTAITSPGNVTCTTATTGCTLTGLTNGTTYTVTVTAANAIGAGPTSAGVTGTPTGLPGAPTGLVLTPGEGGIGVSWTAPANTGSSAITGYTATATGGASCTSAGTSCTISGLTNGSTYSVTVTATNGSGTGPASTASTAIPYPASIMTSARLRLWLDGADTATMFQDTAGTTAAATAGQNVARWNDKSGQGGYVSQPTTGSRPALATVAGRPVPGFDGSDDWLTLATPAQLPSGTNASTEFVVGRSSENDPASSSYRTVWQHGTNTAGAKRSIWKDAWVANVMADVYGGGAVSSGSWSSASPTLVAAEFASGAVSLWTGGRPAVTTTSSFTTGTTYADLGRAGTNGYYWAGPVPEVVVFTGTLTTSERRAVEEYLARKWGLTLTPSAPSSVTATPGDGQVAVSWTAPWDGGSAITGYTATATPTAGTGYGSASTGTCTSAATGCTITGLTNGLTYAVTVTAANAIGTGPSSTAVSAIPYPATVMSSARLSLWLDGADASTLFKDAAGTTPATTAGDSVMRWNDKSSNQGYVSAPTAGNAAALTTVGGRLAPGFNGTSSYLSLANVSQLPSGGSASSEIAVASSDEANPASSTYRFVWERGTASAFAGRAIWKGNGTGLMKADMKNGGVAQAGTIGSNAPLVAVAQYASNALRFTTAGGTVGTSTGTIATGTTYAYVGHNSSTYYWSGPIPEVIVLNTTLTAAEERTLEEYLSRKWGGVVTPAAPTGVTATAGDGSATVSWTAGHDGGAAATYTATATSSTGGATGNCVIAAPATGCTITGLDNGATYTVTISGANTAGTGPTSAASAALVPYPASVMTPARLRLWLDAADTSTMFQDTAATSAATTAGQTVARWNDKSGQGGSLQQSTAASRPTLATLNGRPVPTFDGTNDYLALGTVGQLPSGTSSSTEIVVAASGEASPAASGYRILWQHGSNSTGGARSFYKDNSSAVLLADTFASNFVGGGSVSSTPMIAVGQWAPSAVTLWTAGASTYTASTAFSTTTTYAELGRQSSNGYFWNGPVPELIVLNTTLTTAERRAVEEYLARKWSSPIVPATPTGVTATPADSSATVSWTSGYNGGATATYTATTNTGASCQSVGGTSCTITGLTNGTTYTVTVTPSNSAGTGTASAGVTVTPAGPVANAGFETGSLSGWTCTGSDAVVSSPVHTGSYAATATNSAGNAARCSQTITGLTQNTTYSYKLWAYSGNVNIGFTAGGSSGSTGQSVGAAWTQISRSVTTGAGVTSVTIWFEASSGSVTVDDVTFG